MRGKVIKGEFDDPEWLSKGVCTLYLPTTRLTSYPESRDLIQKILQKDPMKRLTIRQIFAHPWFAPPRPDPSTPRCVAHSSTPPPASYQPTPSREIDTAPAIISPAEDAHLITLFSTPPEHIFHNDLLETPKPNGHNSGNSTSTHSNSSEATFTPPGEETYEEFSTRMAPHLNIVTVDPQTNSPEINDMNGNKNVPHITDSLHPFSATSCSSKSHPPSAVRTPVRTKRRSVSSNLSSPPNSPTTDKHNGQPQTGFAATSTPYPYQDFATLLNTPAPIIFSTPLERSLLTSLSALGFDTAQIVHSVLSDACDAAGALWWMLKRKAEKKALAEARERENGTPDFDSASPPPAAVTAGTAASETKPSNTRASTAVSNGKRTAVSVSVQTDIVGTHTHALSATRSAPQLALVPATPTFSPPVTPPSSRSPTQTHLSPSPTPTAAGSSSRSHPSTPSGSLRDKADGVWGKGRIREGKARSGSVSIMQRATTALEAAGLVRKKSSEGVRDEKERERERERIASGEEPRSSYGSSSSKLTKSGHGHGKSSNPATSAPSTPPSESQHTQVGSPWVLTEAQQVSPPNTMGRGAPTPANSPNVTGDPFISSSSSAPNMTAGKQPSGRTRHRASLLTTFRLWFNDDRKGKRKDPNSSSSATSTTAPGTSRGSMHAHRVSMNMSGNAGTAKRRMSGTGSTGTMSARKVNHRAHRPSVSSRRSSSANSRRSSAASAQIILLDPPLVIEQKPTRRSIGSHTPNSERGEYSSRPSSVRSMSGHGQVHKKSPSASSASSMHFRASSPMSKYNNHNHNHKRAGSGSSTRVVRQIHSAHHHHHHGPRHGRSNSASSSLHTPTSSRPTSFYEFPSETDGTYPRNVSPFRPPASNRRSLDETRNGSNAASTTTFIAQKRQTPFMSPSSGSTSLSRSSWKKSWGLEPPGWQSRTAAQSLLPIEVLAVSPATGAGGDVRDVFSGKGSGSGSGSAAGHLNLGDESDWVDEDDELPAFAGGLGQTPALAKVMMSGSGTTSNSTATSAAASSVKLAAEPATIQLSPPPGGRRGMKQRSNRGSGGATSTTGTANRSKPGHSPIERPAPMESNYDELRGGRRQLPSGRSGPAFRHAIQEEDEGEEE